MVSSSTFARLILMSPAITRPLSKTRSRMSTRPCVRVGFTSSGMKEVASYWLLVAGCSHSLLAPGSKIGFGSCQQPPTSNQYLSQPSERSQVDIQVRVGQAKRRFQLVHTVVQLEQRQTQPFDLLVTQCAPVHTANCLMLK